MEPRRIQRLRVPGWRMPPDAVYVGRPTKWGNPFKVGEPCEYHTGHDDPLTATAAVELYRQMMEAVPFDMDPEELRGRNLACWCPLNQPCHADILLELANRPVCEALPAPAQGDRDGE